MAACVCLRKRTAHPTAGVIYCCVAGAGQVIERERKVKGGEREQEGTEGAWLRQTESQTGRPTPALILGDELSGELIKRLDATDFRC